MTIGRFLIYGSTSPHLVFGVMDWDLTWYSTPATDFPTASWVQVPDDWDLPTSTDAYVANQPAPTYVSLYTNTLGNNKDQKSQNAQVYYSSLFVLSNGYTYNSVLYDISAPQQVALTPQTNYAGLSILSGSTFPWDPTTYWTAADMSRTVFGTASDFYAFGAALLAYAQSCKNNLDTILSAIAGAADQTALDAIDITAGYPTPHN